MKKLFFILVIVSIILLTMHRYSYLFISSNNSMSNNVLLTNEEINIVMNHLYNDKTTSELLNNNKIKEIHELYDYLGSIETTRKHLYSEKSRIMSRTYNYSNEIKYINVVDIIKKLGVLDKTNTTVYESKQINIALNRYNDLLKLYDKTTIYKVESLDLHVDFNNMNYFENLKVDNHLTRDALMAKIQYTDIKHRSSIALNDNDINKNDKSLIKRYKTIVAEYYYSCLESDSNIFNIQLSNLSELQNNYIFNKNIINSVIIRLNDEITIKNSELYLKCIDDLYKYSLENENIRIRYFDILTDVILEFNVIDFWRQND